MVPNKLASAEYAAGVRRLLAVENRLLSLRDYSAAAVFPVGVYPLVFTVVKERPRPDRQTVLCQRTEASSGVASGRLGGTGSASVRSAGAASVTEHWHSQCHARLPYRRFVEPGRPWELSGGAGEAAVIEKMRAFPPLDSVATVFGAATVAEAYRIKESSSRSSEEGRLARGAEGDSPIFVGRKLGQSPGCEQFRVVNSGTIDRYRDLWSEKPLRYLGGSYARPVVAADDLGRLSANRLAQARTAKIIVAGMTRRLECTVDLEGRVLAAKSTSIVLPRVDARHLLGILNSKAVSFYFSAVFGGNRLAGGYLRIGPPQLRRLPIPVLDSSRREDRRLYARLTNLVGRMLALGGTGRASVDSAGTASGCHVPRLRGHVNSATSSAVLEPNPGSHADASVGHGTQKEIAALDRRIDRLVYRLYGLTDGEIAVIEATVAKSVRRSSSPEGAADYPA